MLLQSIEPKWTSLKNKANLLKSTASNYSGQLKHHVDNMKKSIREANKRIAEQEKEGTDIRLNFKKDANTNEMIEGLPSARELNRKKWSRKLEFYLDSLQETLFTATRALNDVTGYSSIQKLRDTIGTLENRLDIVKRDVKKYKNEYADAIEKRATSQKELNELLQRKSSWSPDDLQRFTKLYTEDASNSQRERDLKDQVRTIEAKEDQLNDDLYRAILTRYHEEQIWSDKIRRTSTWGTLILMGVNIFLFLILQLLLEPWKRRRLTRSFEDKVTIALKKYNEEQSLKFDQLKDHNYQILGTSSTESIEQGLINDISEKEQQTDKYTHTEEYPIKKSSTLQKYLNITSNILKRFLKRIQVFQFLKLDYQISVDTFQVYMYSAALLFLGGFFARVI